MRVSADLRRGELLVWRIPAQPRPDFSAQILFRVFPTIEYFPMLVRIREHAQDLPNVGARGSREIPESQRVSQARSGPDGADQHGELSRGFFVEFSRDG